MKGGILVELPTMAEDPFGADAVDRVNDDAALPSAGARSDDGAHPGDALLAMLPAFDVLRHVADVMDLSHSLPRPLAGFCAGLIDGCVACFDERADIARTDGESDGLTVAESRGRTGRGA